MIRPSGPALAALLLAALAISACSDPGSGGTGVPSASVGAPASEGGLSAPAPAPAPVTSGPEATAPTCEPGSAAALPGGAVSFTGTVLARVGSCLRVDTREFEVGTAQILRASGMPATLDDLLIGTRVTVTPVAGDPGTAERVVIEPG